MLRSQFSAIFNNFGQKIGVLHENQCYGQFLHNLALFSVKTPMSLQNFPAKTFLKIITIGPRK
jgi:hypothetical protein